MKIAIIGAGFTGLALCWHLLQKQVARIVLFDTNGIGGGASGLATGLLHPYPGEQVRRSRFADEGLQATNALLSVAEEALQKEVVSRKGILRRAMDASQAALLAERGALHGDIEQLDASTFLITSGMTVYAPLYLEGLWQACAKKGAQLEKRSIASLQELDQYDCIIIAAGAGIKAFPECAALSVNYIKGQVLSYSLSGLEKSIIAKGYITRDVSGTRIHAGATYEREFVSANPDRTRAEELLLPHFKKHFPELDGLQAIDCRAAVRVVRKGDYFPLIQRINPKTWAVTGFGSRGLLYHAYLAEQLSALW